MARPTLPATRRIALLTALAGANAFAQTPRCPPPRVLFVCPAGTVKSAIAREMLRRRAAAQGVAVLVQSRGIHPEDHVSAGLAENLRRDGISLAGDPVKALTVVDIDGADIVIAFDEAARAPGMSKALRWVTPSWNDDYPGAKAALTPQLERLLSELRGARC